MKNIGSELKYTLRLLLKKPLFSLLAIAIMSTGLTLYIFMFSFKQGTLMAPIPFENGERLRRIDATIRGITLNQTNMMLHDYEDLKKRVTSWDLISAYGEKPVSVGVGPNSLKYDAIYATESLFEVSDAVPRLGRLLTNADTSSGAVPVVLLSYEVWQKMFAQQENVIGKKIKINGINTTIVGVMEKPYQFPGSAKMWLPLKSSASEVARGKGERVTVYGWLKNGVSNQQANFELRQIMQEFANNFPETNSGRSAEIRTFQMARMGNGAEVLSIAVEVSLIVILLLACINVANLLYSRAMEKNMETAVRVALGAPRMRLIRQVMWESLLICLISAAIALLISYVWLSFISDNIASLLPQEPPFWFNISLTSFSVLVALGITVGTAILTGFLPAWKASGSDFNSVLRSGTRGAQSKASGRLSMAIVIFEIALSCALLILSTTFVKSIYQQNQANYGVDINGFLTSRVSLPDTYDKTQLAQYHFNLAQNLKHDVKIADATVATSFPSDFVWYPQVVIDGKDYGKSTHDYGNYIIADQNYFSTFGFDLIEGRSFNSKDRLDTQQVAVVSLNFAKQHWPNSSALGKRIKLKRKDSPWLTIVGVVNDVLYGQNNSNYLSRGTIYTSLYQQPQKKVKVAMKSHTEPYDLKEVLINTMAKLDANIIGYDILTLEQRVKKRMSSLNFVSDMFVIFALASLFMAFTGIYGVMSKSIIQKQHEIGIKRALGANNVDIFKFFGVVALKQLVIGLIFGLPLGYLLVTMVEKAGMASSSVTIFFLIPLIVTLIITIAVFVPIVSLLKKEPIAALRYE